VALGVLYCVAHDLEGEKLAALCLYFSMDALMRQLEVVRAPEQSEEASPT
jgi:hypothetical protein